MCWEGPNCLSLLCWFRSHWVTWGLCMVFPGALLNKPISFTPTFVVKQPKLFSAGWKCSLSSIFCNVFNTEWEAFTKLKNSKERKCQWIQNRFHPFTLTLWGKKETVQHHHSSLGYFDSKKTCKTPKSWNLITYKINRYIYIIMY